ncbi:ubl carboxyl-terminal hydrolase 18 isoform X5 [Vombatus ursinus]|uniref:ubl carboxyl-terminal hydrolase 18 isoform X5 n=1 Tax=Vombatus ursinus TaxID=29139 RepID=UPI000FFD2932|nr:ubl carboxyl-terminal hydrolase 18 isoform X5 [Vombatus ursinus]
MKAERFPDRCSRNLFHCFRSRVCLAEPPRSRFTACSPVGLYNIGQTCCLNSLLQVFIMNLNFTKILKNITMPREQEERKRSVPYQLLLLLEKMQDSRVRALRPVELASCLQNYNVPLFVDHDAAQLFLTLWNLIQSQITDSELSERLKNLYTITIRESLVCLDCNVKNHRDSSMLTLSLPVLDIDSQPLKTLTMKVTNLPPTLTLHLMRFSSKNFSRTQKIIHPLSFPKSLDFSQVLPAVQDWWDPEGQQYELFAVVAHMGTASCGHYCAYICNPADGRWFCFNDSNVCWATWEDIKKTYGNCYLSWGETAYLLVYTKTESQLASSPATSMTVR